MATVFSGISETELYKKGIKTKVMNIEKLISKIEKEQKASHLWIKSSYVLMHIKTPEQMNELNDIVQGVYQFIIDEYLKKSVVKDSFTTEKNERQLFEAFLSGYDSGYDAKASNMINDNVANGVRYIRRNFNEDFEL